MPDDWAIEMQAQFNDLKKDIQEHFDLQKRGMHAQFDEQTNEMQAQFGDQKREMQAQFDHQSREMHAQFEKQTVELSRVISTELQKRLGDTEARLSGQYQTAVEDVRKEVRLLGEASSGTLEAIQRDIHALDAKFSSTLQLHAKVLAQHSRDIDELKGRGQF
jgi:hypothetical protein